MRRCAHAAGGATRRVRCARRRGGGSIAVFVDAPGDDARGVDADEGRVHARTLGVAARLMRLGAATDLDAVRLPAVLGVDAVDDERGFASGLGVAELLAGAEAATPAADVDGIERGVVGEADRGEVRHAVGADGAEAAQALAVAVGDLAFAEMRHERVLLRGSEIVSFRDTAWPRGCATARWCRAPRHAVFVVTPQGERAASEPAREVGQSLDGEQGGPARVAPLRALAARCGDAARRRRGARRRARD